jgi:hypothetical protein
MPAANVGELRARLDAFARSRLTLADFDPVLDLDGELWLGDVTPELFQALRLLEPYGVGNPEPVFAARGVQLTAPPRIMKDKHVKLKLRAGAGPAPREESEELTAAAILATPRCHPDGAAIRRSEREAATLEVGAQTPSSFARTDSRGRLSPHDDLARTCLASKITFDALGWHMAERLEQTPLLAGDTVDIAFSIGHNDHPEYGGLELELRDFRVKTA